MKGKLNKVDNGYVLLVDNIMYATDNDKLSQSNCDEIFGIVDVNKLAEEWVFDKNGHKWSNNDNSAGDNYGSYKEGFNKAMELNKDRLFTIEDMKRAYLESNKYEWFGDLIKSIQQPTEIEVEIKMEPCFYDDSLGGFSTSYTEDKPKEQPKLDSDGCLILKKI